MLEENDTDLRLLVPVFGALEDFLPLRAKGLKQGIFFLSSKGLDSGKSHGPRGELSIADRGAIFPDKILNEAV